MSKDEKKIEITGNAPLLCVAIGAGLLAASLTPDISGVVGSRR